MQFILLPIERPIFLCPKAIRKNGILSTISSWAGAPSGSVSIFKRDYEKNTLKEIFSLEADLKIVYFLIRYRGGGKGGFRKQLEKKAREFARAKRKEKETHKGKEQNRGDQPKEKKTLPAESPKIKLTTKTEDTSSRVLARQGVNFIFSKYCG